MQHDNVRLHHLYTSDVTPTWLSILSSKGKSVGNWSTSKTGMEVHKTWWRLRGKWHIAFDIASILLYLSIPKWQFVQCVLRSSFPTIDFFFSDYPSAEIVIQGCFNVLITHPAYYQSSVSAPLGCSVHDLITVSCLRMSGLHPALLLY